MLRQRSALLTLLTTLAVVLVPRSSAANELVPFAPELVCPAPISICDDSNVGLDCPVGYHCTCVPRCPECDDCAARVCVANATRECRTACDCQPGLGCFDGQCIAGFAPVFCCDAGQCPTGQQCQHRDGRMSRCRQACVEQVWRCQTPGNANPECGADRVCSCTASCPVCEDCGPGVCVPAGTPTPYRCNEDGSCTQPGDRCICASSCAECDDCAMNICVPRCDAKCESRLRTSNQRIDRIVEHSRACESDQDCVRVDTSNRCRGTCGVWVNARRAALVRNFSRYLDRRYCRTYQGDGCPFSTPSCVEETGACIAGVCRGVTQPE